MMTVNEIKKQINSFEFDFGELPDFSGKYPNPEILPNTHHPRVWVNAEALPRMRASMHHPENKVNLDKVILKANSNTDGILLPRGDAGLNFDYEPITDVECMAYMYLATADERYGYNAIRCAKNFLATVDFAAPNNGDEFYHYSNLSGYAMHVMAEVYDWCYGLMTERDKAQIAVGTANRLGPNLEVKYPPNAAGGVTGHGLGAIMLRDWLSFAIATYDEYPQFYNCVVGRILAEYVDAPNFYYPSGANFQGSCYGINKTYLHMVSEILMKVATGVKIYAPDVSFEATVATYMHYMRPDGESLRLGDDYAQWKTYGHGDAIRLAFFGGVYYGNAALKAWSAALSDNFETLKWIGRCEMNPVIFLVMNDPALDSSEATQYSLPNINYNGKPYGAITARSAWNDTGAWMTYCKVGEIYGANHDHKDAGTFQVFYKGPLALNSSCYQYMGRAGYGSLLDLGYNKQTVSKNGLLVFNPEIPEEGVGGWEPYCINSGGQRFRGLDNGENPSLEYWLARSASHQAKTIAHDYKYDENGRVVYSYIAGDITNAYYENTVRSITRRMISVATGNDAHPLVFMTYDRLSSVKPSFKKTYLLHVPNEPTVNGNVITVDNRTGGVDPNLCGLREENNGKLVNTVMLPRDVEMTVIGGEGKRFFVNGRNLIDIELKAGELLYRTEVGWGRVEISPKEHNISDTFFNVMYVGDADKDDAYVAPAAIESATHDGALIFGKAVLFPKCDSAAAFDVSFELKADAYCIIIGLEAGKWQVSLDDNPLCTYDVTPDAHLAEFNAPAGRITLEKA